MKRARVAIQGAAAVVRAALTLPGLDGIHFTYGMPSAEKVDPSFEQFVAMAYAGNSVVFGVERTRIALFSEATFKYRNKKTKRLHGNGDLAVLETPWPNGSTGDLLARMEQDAAFAGNAYIRRAGDRLERLRPDWVTIISIVDLDELGHEIRTVVGYLYEPYGDPERQTDFYPVEEVAHWAPTPDPLANFRGMSWLTPVIREINADLAMTHHREAYFRNHATPNLIIKYATKLSPELVTKISQQVSARHAGPENAGRTMVLDQGADPMIVGQKLDDMFSAIQAAGENRIAVAAGVPAIVAGLKEGLNAATLANFGEAMRSMADITTRPAWRGVCAALGTIIDVPADSQLWFDTSDIAALQAGEKEQAEALQIKAATASTFLTSGYTHESVKLVITSGDTTLLEHSGLYSVQLRPPGVNEPPASQAPGDVSPDGQQPADPSPPPSDGQPVDEPKPGDASKVARAAKVRTGAMIALVPSDADLERLAVDGGEPVDELHTTLLYLGKAADYPPEARQAILDAVQGFAAGLQASVAGDGFAISIFNPSGDETCIVLGLSGGALDDVHDQVADLIRDVESEPAGFTLPEQHEPWIPHVTLVFTDALAQAAELTDRVGPVLFDRIRVAFADHVVDVPLTGPGEDTLALAAEPDEPAEKAADRTVARYDPHQLRDPGGEDGGRWVTSPATALKDTLKLAGKIDLDDDETLVGSAKIDGDGGIRMALTEQGGKRMLRLGLGTEGYGKANREEGIPAWTGNPPGSPLSKAEHDRLDAEHEALDAEYDSASLDRQEEISARQADILEQLNTGDEEFNGGTAKLDEYSMVRLAAKLRPALEQAVEQEKAENKAWDELQALEAKGNPDPARMAELRQIVDRTDYIVFDEGDVVGSEWGDVHYSVELDDPTVGPTIHLGVKPKGAPDDWGDGRDWQGQFDAAEIRKFLRMLDKFAR